MKTLSSICAAIALAVAATPAPAQVSIRAGVTIGARGHDHGRPIERPVEHRHVDRYSGHRHVDRGHVDIHVHSAPSGYWRTVYDEVHVPGYWREEHVPARYGWTVDNCGHRCWGVVEAACCRQVWVPPRCESRPRRIWVSC